MSTSHRIFCEEHDNSLARAAFVATSNHAFLSMKKSNLSRLAAVLGILAIATSARAHDAAKQMTEAANWLLATLKPEQKAKITFEFNNEERENWHFIPRERKGLPMKEMTQEQRLLAHALLNTGLSSSGELKASAIMSLEEVLYNIESAADESKRAATREKRDPEKLETAFRNSLQHGRTSRP